MARGVAVGACGRVRVKDINEMKICTGIIIMNKAEKITPINTSHFLQKLQNVVSRGVLETIKRWGYRNIQTYRLTSQATEGDGSFKPECIPDVFKGLRGS